MFIPLDPLQMASLAGMAHQRNKLAIEQNKIALETQETLKKIEQQNRETLKRIEIQNHQIKAAKNNSNVSSPPKPTKPNYAIRGIPFSTQYTTCPRCHAQTRLNIGECQSCGFNRWKQRP